ncbi:MAG TPA: serine/threonine-protein kinase [Thermoanaerobaculia bacterium]|nr:serine/threonine-protein kinase [Thermoanaerobaculia bacterium]
MAASDDWRRIKDLFLQALERDPKEREGFLGRVGDESLRAELGSLLEAHEEAGEFIARPRVVGQSGLLEAITGNWALGRRMGPYRITRQLGRGSLGSVFAARDEEQGSDVAIELLSPEAQTVVGPEAVRDLVARVQRVASPALARLLDSGVTAEGLPYLVAERVRGVPLDQHCDRQRLPVAARLALFDELLAAVAAAHREGLVHTDLKPRNVVVDEAGALRLLDLGLSSLLAGQLAAVRVGPLPRATTPYSSPEQVRGEEPTVASDLWALGALLYELLTGHPPHGEGSLSPDALKRSILSGTPEPPSQAVRRPLHAPDPGGGLRLVATAEELAARRDSDPQRLVAGLAGGLEELLLAMLAADPARRPESVAAVRQRLRALAG